MRVVLEGQVLNIHLTEFTSKKGETWETVHYQVLSSYPGQLMELETIEDMQRKGETVINQDMQVALRGKGQVRILSNCTISERDGRRPTFQHRILAVEPLEVRKDKAEKPAAPEMAGASK